MGRKSTMRREEIRRRQRERIEPKPSQAKTETETETEVSEKKIKTRPRGSHSNIFVRTPWHDGDWDATGGARQGWRPTERRGSAWLSVFTLFFHFSFIAGVGQSVRLLYLFSPPSPSLPLSVSFFSVCLCLPYSCSFPLSPTLSLFARLFRSPPFLTSLSFPLPLCPFPFPPQPA